jgi:hypothetical protein
MSDLTARIEALEPAEAVRILRAIAKQRLRNRPATEPAPDTQLAATLTAAPEGDVAKVCLVLLAADPDMHPIVESMIENPAAVSFVDPGTLAIGLGALVVLQAYIKFERDKEGKWTFKFEKKPLSDTLLGQVISKLGGWLGAK